LGYKIPHGEFVDLWQSRAASLNLGVPENVNVTAALFENLDPLFSQQHVDNWNNVYHDCDIEDALRLT
jgi:hypothetical protein